jgi:mono/diheme cytochrome c family protein
MIMHRLAIGAGFAALLCGVLIGRGAVAASAENGKTAFIKNGCFECHGTVGQGSVQTSGGRVLTNTKLPYDGFAGYVRSTNRQMPPYSEQILSDGDLADIYAYLTSLPKTPDFKTIPLLNQ